MGRSSGVPVSAEVSITGVVNIDPVQKIIYPRYSLQGSHTGLAGNYGWGALYNPVGSGKTLFVDYCSVGLSDTNGGKTALNLYRAFTHADTGAIAAVSINGDNGNSSAKVSWAHETQIYHDKYADSGRGGVLVAELNETRELYSNDPIRIPEGWALVALNYSGVGGSVGLVARWEERVL